HDPGAMRPLRVIPADQDHVMVDAAAAPGIDALPRVPEIAAPGRGGAADAAILQDRRYDEVGIRDRRGTIRSDEAPIADLEEFHAGLEIAAVGAGRVRAVLCRRGQARGLGPLE